MSRLGRQAERVALAIAHRAPAGAAACAALAADGVGVFEIDVQEIDGTLVSSHFLPVHPRLSRLRRDRRSFTWRRRTPAEIALVEAVAAVPAGAEVLLDLKTDRGEAALELIDRLAAARPDPSRCLVSTKGWHTLDAVRAAGYRTWRTVADPTALATVLGGPALADDAVTVRHTLLTPEVIRELRAKVPAVMTWTVNDTRRARELLAAGVDGITSDSAEVLRLVVAAGHGSAPPAGADGAVGPP